MQVPPAYVGTCDQWRKYYGNNMSIFFCSGALAVPFFTCAEFYHYTWQCIFKLGHTVTLKQSFIQDFLLWDGDLMLRECQCMQ